MPLFTWNTGNNRPNPKSNDENSDQIKKINLNEALSFPARLNQETLRKAKNGDAAAECKIGLKFKIDGYILSELQTLLVFEPDSTKEFEDAFSLTTTSEQAYSEAFKWLSRSAEQGYGPAEYYLALMYRDGTGVEKSEQKYRELSERSSKHAAIRFEVPKTPKTLKQLPMDRITPMLAEVDKGNAQAMYDLAWGFLQKNPIKGEEVPIFKTTGFMFPGMLDAQDTSNKYRREVSINIGGGYGYRFDEPEGPSETGYLDEIKIANVFVGNAMYLLEMAAKSGHHQAEEDYSALMDYGLDSISDPKTQNRMRWLSKNLNNCSPSVECAISLNLPPSEQYAVLIHAAERGYSPAYILLAELFECGVLDDLLDGPEYPYMARNRNYKEDARKAKYAELVKKAAVANNPYAMILLASCYFEKEDCDPKAVFDLFMNAAKLGNVHAMFNVAMSYQLGDFVPKSDDKAIEWYTKAAKAGDQGAIKHLKADYGIEFKTDRQREKEEFDNRSWR